MIFPISFARLIKSRSAMVWIAPRAAAHAIGEPPNVPPNPLA